MPSITRTQFGDLFFATALPALQKVVNDEWEINPEFAPMIASTPGGKGSVYQTTQVWGAGQVGEVVEGGKAMDYTPTQGFRQTLTYKKYGGKAPCTNEAMEDGRFPEILKGHRSLARSVRETRNVQFVSMLINGTSASFPGPDGKALFASDHPTRYGTQSNLATVSADFDYESFASALTDFYSQKTPEGHFAMISPSIVVGGPYSGLKMMESTAGGDRPDTSNRAKNVLDKLNRGAMPKPIIIPHLSTLTDDWGLFASPGRNGLMWIDRKAPYEKHWADEETETDFFAIYYRSAWGWSDYIGTMWNQG